MISPQTCPICDKELPADASQGRLFPFCSLRCKQVDLYRWMHGKYSIIEPLRPDESEPWPFGHLPDPDECSGP